MVKYILRVSCLSEKCTRINANLGDFDRQYINEELIGAKPDSTPSVVTIGERENSCNSCLTASWYFNIEIKDLIITKLILIKK